MAPTITNLNKKVYIFTTQNKRRLSKGPSKSVKKNQLVLNKLLHHNVVPEVFQKGSLRYHSLKEEQLSKSP